MVRGEELERQAELRKQAAPSLDSDRGEGQLLQEQADEIIRQLEKLLLDRGFFRELKFKPTGQLINPERSVRIADVDESTLDSVRELLPKLMNAVESGAKIPEKYLAE